MSGLELLQINLLSPVVLAFVLGIVATLIHSDLRFPQDLYTGLSIYLLLAIGLKGGVELAAAPLSSLWRPILATLLLGCLTPLLCFAVLRRFGRFSVVDAAALAAHYGSVSVVTFLATLAFLEALGIATEGFLPALVALLEVPAIFIALALAKRDRLDGAWKVVVSEVIASKSIVLLLGGLVIGALVGKTGFAKVEPFFVAPFQGVLMLFLLELGMVAARRLRDLRVAGGFLVVFALGMPPVLGALGVLAGWASGLSLGGATVLGALAASASYIAAPAAVRVALPEANPGYYLTASLAITFPFNLSLGIPLYHEMASWLFARG